MNGSGDRGTGADNRPMLATGRDCPDCGRTRREAEPHCPLCGHLFRVAADATPPPAPAPRPSAGFPSTRAAETAHVSEARIAGLPEPWFFLLAGLAPLALLAWSWRFALFGWYFGALVHEMGHCAAAWFVGMPAFPVLSLDAQAMARHSEQVAFLPWLLLGAFAWCAWQLPAPRLRWTALGLVALGYPVLAFTEAKEPMFLAAGHLAELAFAGLCFWRALTGGFTSSRAERFAYSAVGWHLLAVNVWLTVGLACSAGQRRWYVANRSFGLENDYSRLARALGFELEGVGLLMTLPALLVLPVALGLWHLTRPEKSA